MFKVFPLSKQKKEGMSPLIADGFGTGKKNDNKNRRNRFICTEQIVTNDDLAKIVETNDEWIRSRTGIGARRIATSESTSYMAAEASIKALENAGVKPEEIDLILLATSSPDYCFPNGACEVQGRIGAVNAACFDLSVAFAIGFVFALNTAHAFISSGIYKTALVIGADVLSKLIDWTDRGTHACYLETAQVQWW